MPSYGRIFILAARKILANDWLVYFYDFSFQKRGSNTVRAHHSDIISLEKNTSLQDYFYGDRIWNC